MPTKEKGSTKRFSDLFSLLSKSREKIPMCWQIDDGKIVLFTPRFFFICCVKSISIYDLTCLWPSKKTKRRKLLIKTLSLQKFRVSAFLSSVWFLRPLLLQKDQNMRDFLQPHQWFTISVLHSFWLILCCWAFAFNYFAYSFHRCA